MAIVTTDDRHYGDIAAAIREKNGSQTQYLPEQMAAAIAALPTVDFEIFSRMTTGETVAASTSYSLNVTGLTPTMSKPNLALIYDVNGSSGTGSGFVSLLYTRFPVETGCQQGQLGQDISEVYVTMSANRITVNAAWQFEAGRTYRWMVFE